MSREASEQRYRLSQGERLQDRTWAYTLGDTSGTNIRALVQDPVVEDTAEIERTAFRVSRASTRGRIPPSSHPRIAAALRIVTVISLLIALIGLTLGLVERVAPGTMAAWSATRPPEAALLSRRQRYVLLMLLGTLLVLDVASMRRMTVTADEPRHLLYGQQILALDSTRFDDSKMPVTAFNALPGALAAGLPPGPLTSFLGRLETGRYLTVFFSLLVALCVFAWTRDLYGTSAGLLALTLYTFDPNLLAHSQLITTDLYAVGTLTVALYVFWRFLRVGGWKLAVASALLLGLAQIAKYTAIALFPLLAVIAVAFHAGELRRDLRERRLHALRRRAIVFSGVALVFVALSLIVVNLGFLFNQTLMPLDQYQFHSNVFRSIQSSAGILGELPLPIPHPFLEGLDMVMEHERTGSSYGRIYLFGELRQGEGFPGYYFYASLYKVPIATQLVLLAAGVAYVARRRRFNLLRDEVVLLLPVLFFVLYFNFFYRAQIGIRYFLVVFPLLYIFSGTLLAKGVRVTRSTAVALSVAVAGLMLSVLSYYPHFLPYFNELVWNRTRAYTVLADSNIDWGQNGWYVAQYHATHPGAVDEPDRPVAGTVLVRVNALTGVTGDPDKFRWLRTQFTPVDHVGYATLVYEIAETDLKRIGDR
jgi:4-amino-4-deoxy-L-arabinose transferase-like glycosyltransferase